MLSISRHSFSNCLLQIIYETKATSRSTFISARSRTTRNRGRIYPFSRIGGPSSFQQLEENRNSDSSPSQNRILP